MTETPAKPVRLQSTFIRGAAWSMAMRWGIKLLGLISTVILARIISPEDYGIVAMAMLFAGMAEVLVDFGAQINILRKQTLDRDFIDSAWSLQIIQGGFVATLLALSAPLAGVYFNEPRVVWVIWVIAACLLFDGLTNIGITLARKNFEFKLEFRYRIVGKLIGVVATIIAALFLRDYRALVAGLALGHVSNVFLSYFMHPYRPRWNTAKIRSMWGFSKWLLISGVGTFAARKADQRAVIPEKERGDDGGDHADQFPDNPVAEFKLEFEVLACQGDADIGESIEKQAGRDDSTATRS